MWRSLHQRGLLSLAICLACAAGVRFAPAWIGEPIRNGLRSSLAPGASVVAKVEDWSHAATSRTANAWTNLVAGAASVDRSSEEQWRSQRDAAFAQVRRLEVVVAELKTNVQQAQDQAALRIPLAVSGPLWHAQLVPARVIGHERTSIEQIAARLVQCGTRDGIALESLVIDPALWESSGEDRPTMLLDQGGVARNTLCSDLPVASGQTLVGRIRAVGALTSTVQVVTDPEFRIGAQILRITGQGPVFGGVGVYAGHGPGAGRLELIAATQPVAIGDSIYTDEHVAGEAVRLYIGRVTRAELAPGAPHWTIEVAPGMSAVPAEVEVLTFELNPERALSGARSVPDPREEPGA